MCLHQQPFPSLCLHWLLLRIAHSAGVVCCFPVRPSMLLHLDLSGSPPLAAGPSPLVTGLWEQAVSCPPSELPVCHHASGTGQHPHSKPVCHHASGTGQHPHSEPAAAPQGRASTHTASLLHPRDRPAPTERAHCTPGTGQHPYGEPAAAPRGWASTHTVSPLLSACCSWFS